MLPVIIVIIVLLWFMDQMRCEGITNYNQIRSDYTWTDHYDMQFDDLRDRPVDYHYGDLDTFCGNLDGPVEARRDKHMQKKYFHGLPKPAFGRGRLEKKINYCPDDFQEVSH